MTIVRRPCILFRAGMVSVAGLLMIPLAAAASSLQEEFQYRCVVVPTSSPSSTVNELPPSMPTVNGGETFVVEFWGQDAAPDSTGIVCAYCDLGYEAARVQVESADNCGPFNLFTSGLDAPPVVDELGGCQLSAGMGTAPSWARIACAEFTAGVIPATTVAFDLLPASSESSAYNRGLVAQEFIGYGSCATTILASGPCCMEDNCLDGVPAEECLQHAGTYLGDGLTCSGDPDGDGLVGCADVCPLAQAPSGTDGSGRPKGDLDGDCDVDLMDFAVMQSNFSGPTAGR